MELNDSTPDTLAHRQMVIDYATDVCFRLMERLERDNSVIAGYAADFCDDIMSRAEKHDESKLHEPEKERFDYVGTHQHLGKHEYGSEEYKKSLEYLGPALKHHYEVNDHHPEHFENGIDGMNLMQFTELFCDWEAACHRNKNGSIYQSLEKNKERFSLSEDVYSLLRCTANVLEGGKSNEENPTDLMDVINLWLGCRADSNINDYYDIYDSVDACSDKYRFSDQLYHIFLNTAEALNP